MPTVPDFAGKKKKAGMERSGPTPAAFRRAGWPALRERHRRSTCCYASRSQRSLRLSPPTSGLARSGLRRGAQLDREFAFYASLRRLRARPGGGCGGVCSWTGNRFVRLSPPTSGKAEGAAEGRSAGRGVCSPRLPSGLARRGLRSGRSWTGNSLCTPPAADVGPGHEAATEGCEAGQGIALYASQSRRLRARPGGGGRGWTGS